MRKATLLKALKRKPILALVVGAVVFSSAFAFAATLGVSSVSLGAGNAAVSSCSSTPGSVQTSYAVSYSSALPGYKVDSITVAYPAGCAGTGKDLTVNLTNGSNGSLGQFTASNLTGTSVTINAPASPAIDANAVANVSAVISG